MNILKGGIYKHFKGGIYEVLMLALNTDHGNTDVVYKNNIDEVFTRDLNTWFDEVKPGITRFKKI